MISKDILSHIHLNHQRLLNEVEEGPTDDHPRSLESHHARLTRFLSNIIDYSNAARMEVDPDPRAKALREGNTQCVRKPRWVSNR